MTNDRQSSLGRVSAVSESQLSHRETVQLTELLPVERSRIEDDSYDADQDGTTDGLRALRSFSMGQHQDFAAQHEFACLDKIENSSCDGSANATARPPQKRKIDGNDSRINGDSVRVPTRSILEAFGAGGAGQIQQQQRRRPRRRRRRRRRLPRGVDEETYDNADDEVYYYRRRYTAALDAFPEESLENESARDEEKEEEEEEEDDDDDDDEEDEEEEEDETTTNVEIVSDSDYRDKAEDRSPTPSVTKHRRVDSPAKKRSGKKRGSATPAEAESGNGNERAIREDAEKHLRLKMDGIIQANYLLERENNNVGGEKEEGAAAAAAGDAPKISSAKPSKQPDGESSAEAEGKKRKRYSCVMCDSSFKGSGGLRNHYKVVHAAGPSYKCDECGKEFPLKERLKLHVRTHTGFKPYKCPDCHKSFARGGQLVQHRGTHSKIKPYRCNLCAGTFTCAANLALHVKRHNGQKDHKCQICGRGFVRKDALKKHLECLHRDVKSFLCVICNKTFKGHLPQHMRTHAQDRPHGCATCGQRFAQKSQLTVHQRTHSGQRPFRCLVCWQAFAHSTALKLHTRRHTGERPFKCVECNAGFTQLPHWKKHMKCIHGRSEPYSCKRCDSHFRIKSDLENHEKTCSHGDASADSSRSGGDDADRDASTAERGIGSAGTATVTAVSAAATAAAATAAAAADAFPSDPSKYRSMNVERMRLLLAVLLKRISRPERLDQLGFGKRLIDEVLQDSLVSAGKEPSRVGQLDELQSLRKNLETFLEWTVPKEHWQKFRRINKTPEEILETLTAT